LARELDPVVARVPDEGDAHRLVRRRVEVPTLPADELSLRDRGRGRGDDGGDGERGGEGRCDTRYPTRRQAGEEDERREDDARPHCERMPVSRERRGPARADEEDADRRDGPTECDGEPEGEDEPEDRGEDDTAHVRLDARIERRPNVVEVEEA